MVSIYARYAFWKVCRSHFSTNRDVASPYAWARHSFHPPLPTTAHLSFTKLAWSQNRDNLWSLEFLNHSSALKMSKAAALAQLRALRASGKKRLDLYEVADQGAVYDEVDEEGYKKVVRSRLDQDDFVIDDNGEGYADDGREEWQAERRYDSSSDGEELPLKGKAAKRKREEDKEKIEKTNNKIMDYFSNGPVVVAAKPKVRAFQSVVRRNTHLHGRLLSRLKIKLSWLTCLAISIPMSLYHAVQREKRSNQRHAAKYAFFRRPSPKNASSGYHILVWTLQNLRTFHPHSPRSMTTMESTFKVEKMTMYL